MRSVALILGLVAVATLPAGSLSQPLPTVLEEVVAVVGESPVLESDLRLARLVGLVDSGDGRPSRSELLAARVRLELQFTDLEASGTLFRLQLDVEGTLQQLVENGGGAAQVRQGLAGDGLSWDDLRDLAVRLAAAAAFTEQRLRPRIRLTAEELRTAYSGELTPQLAARGQTPPPFPEVRELLHRLLTERRLNAEIEMWLSTARTQHPVTIFRP